MKLCLLVFIWFCTFLILSATGITGLNPLSLQATLQFSFFLLFYLLGSVLALTIPFKKNNNNMMMIQKKSNLNLLFIFLTIFLIYSIIIIINLHLINKIEIDSYRKAFFDGSRNNLKYFGGAFLFYLYYIMTLIVFSLIPFFVGTSKIKIQLLMFMCIVSYDLIYLSRTGIYYFLIAFICSAAIRNIKLKKILFLTLIVLLFSVIVSIYRDASKEIVKIINNTIINYHIAPLILFDKNIITEKNIFYDGFGYASLGIYNVIFKIVDPHIMESINELRAQMNIFYNLSNSENIYMPYNAYYTTLGLFYIDIGFIGCCIITLLSGLVLSLLIRKSKNSECYKIISIFFASLLIESLFSPITINIFAFVIIMFTLIYFLIRKKI
ncbi:O-antigen polymerase [Xenorhabdus sp. PB62.4]|uniref:O-antigen polymerase n=1 Tax=Xenorhabdus sp. PB62.4 TaxID=1851573 RepID=UPI001657155E|nr:O-antigen polymerase [Xenorhabdus sp. PB62.4]MBC8954430.1 hypothetical protein [Xenorhabdus sp. PB62.4]